MNCLQNQNLLVMSLSRIFSIVGVTAVTTDVVDKPRKALQEKRI